MHLEAGHQSAPILSPSTSGQQQARQSLPGRSTPCMKAFRALELQGARLGEAGATRPTRRRRMGSAKVAQRQQDGQQGDGRDAASLPPTARTPASLGPT